MENCMALPQKIKTRIATWSSNFTSRCMPPKNQQQGLGPTHCHSGIIHNNKRWEQSTFQHWGINELKQYGLHKQWSDSALKRKEILRHATSWMNLQRQMLSEISQSQEDKCRMIPYQWGTWTSQTLGDRKSRGGQGRGRREWRTYLYGCRASVLQDEKSSGCITMCT